jgi:hypothetical protein
MPALEIQPLAAAPNIRAMLSEILIEVVAHGGSVGFMYPLAPETADAFWDAALADAARDARIILGAWDGGVLAGTVTLLLDWPPNQPHRARNRQADDPPEPPRPRRGGGHDAGG